MKSRGLTILVVTIALAITACSNPPSENAVQTAIAHTQLASLAGTATFVSAHANTSTPAPTNTSAPSLTPTWTTTPTPTFTPTPDLRVITVDPKEFLLQAEDLPEDAKYYLPNSGWISPHRNSEIISGWGSEEGREYIERTGRIDGWWVAYLRGSQTVLAPLEIYHNIIMYETAAGAQLTVEEYSTALDSDYELIDRSLDFGDVSRAMTKKEMQANGAGVTLFL